MSDIHPLEAELRRTGEKKKDFIKRIGISRGTLFDLLRGADKDYGVMLLAKIEDGTGGRVTVWRMMKWLKKHQQKESV